MVFNYSTDGCVKMSVVPGHEWLSCSGGGNAVPNSYMKQPCLADAHKFQSQINVVSTYRLRTARGASTFHNSCARYSNSCSRPRCRRWRWGGFPPQSSRKPILFP